MPNTMICSLLYLQSLQDDVNINFIIPLSSVNRLSWNMLQNFLRLIFCEVVESPFDPC